MPSLSAKTTNSLWRQLCPLRESHPGTQRYPLQSGRHDPRIAMSEQCPRLLRSAIPTIRWIVFWRCLSSTVSSVADVRSRPYSRLHPQFNRDSVTQALRPINVKYDFLGRELGARRSEAESYERNRAEYGLIRRLPAFQEGLTRIRKGVQSSRIALLCAEKDPLAVWARPQSAGGRSSQSVSDALSSEDAPSE